MPDGRTCTRDARQIYCTREQRSDIWGEIHPQVADRYGIGERTYVAVIDILKVMDYATFDRKYEGIARFPAVTRDLSMVVPKEIQAAQIEHMIIQRGGKILESVQLFDIYEGAQIQEGCKSMAYSVVFRSQRKDTGGAGSSSGHEEDSQRTVRPGNPAAPVSLRRGRYVCGFM